MSLQIGKSLRNGFDRATNRNAGLLFVMFFFVSLASTIVTNTATAVAYRRLAELSKEMSEEPLPVSDWLLPSVSVPVPFEIILVLLVLLWIASEAVQVISDRTFISEETERLHEPTRWIGWATLSSLAFVAFFNFLLFFYISSVVFLGVLTPVLGLFWALIGGVGTLVLSLLLFFTRQEIATRDVGPIEAMTGSWSLARTNEIELFGLGVVLILIEAAQRFLVLALGSVRQLFTIVASSLLGAVALVFFSAVVAQAYRQLRLEREDDGSETTADSLDPNDEWDDPPL
ncbi:hypothetical protein [Halocatena pleomorpha]|uniref:DUF7847 domain-containing protein n=1 Tax=Halocatena pleomorpha TaxID=1785090 RepID=A0A3P3RID8_9EURY|nr:hypothetical protein [Halocatena pleomorpha]RRJ32173.1 hypothetical protein EIK79_05240 [Halocatena pleomorpha]